MPKKVKKQASKRVSKRSHALEIKPYFARILNEPSYVRASTRILDSQGEVVFEWKDVEVPSSWSQLASDILISKYLRRSGVRGGAEKSARQVVERISDTIANFSKQVLSSGSARALGGELRSLLLHQVAAFNSPVWFNLGLWAKYKIKSIGGGGNFRHSHGKTLQLENNYEFPQCSACFIQSVGDDLMSIFELAKTEARIFKYGSGTGTNFSNLRGRGESLESGGTSSGLMSFLEVLDRGAGAIKSGGTTRRAAKMVCLDVDHPEILDFIAWKSREEKKARALIGAGYDSDFNGEAYRTVSGQNSNNSVRVSDEFMRAVESGGEWQTRARLDGRVMSQMAAREIWDQIAKSAWNCADPGVQFETTINDWHTCSASGAIRASNPCSEYMFLADTACNLASLNLVKFQTRDGFNLEGYLSAIRSLIIAQDTLVDLSSYPTEAIARQSVEFRPLGLGYANLGAFLMRLGIPYDSDRGREWAALLTSIMTAQAYVTSAELASQHGTFTRFAENRRSMLRVIEKHREAARSIVVEEEKVTALGALHEVSCELWDQVLAHGRRHGFRNSQVTVLAPTGTIGLLMDCDTTGIEPEYSIVKNKKLAGGGSLRMVNQSIPMALAALGYGSDESREIVDYAMKRFSLSGAPHLRSEDLAVFDCATRSGGRMISSMGHLRMMAAVQPFLSGAISKTVNLPSEATVDDVREIYFQAWKLGLKAIAIYRDGSKSSQPLNTEMASVYPVKCPDCGHLTELSAGCARCLNCGASLGCG